jgi:Phage tail sheath C-terminal domain
MAQLSSPGVAVTVIDESFYTPAAPGTTPLIIVASKQDKQNGAGTGVAPGTTKANAGKVYLLTSQKDLADTFGTPRFVTDSNNNPVHGSELNEYGLQAAYSYLGVSNRAYVVRADIDLGQLEARADAPVGRPVNGTYWIDVGSTKFGIFEWNSHPSNVKGGQTFSNKVPLVITDTAKLLDGGQPRPSIGSVGNYAVVATTSTFRFWYKAGAIGDYRPAMWVEVGSNDWISSWPTLVSNAAVDLGMIVDGSKFNVNGQLITINAATPGSPTLQDIVDAINMHTPAGTFAIGRIGKIFIYSDFDSVVIDSEGIAQEDLVNLDALGVVPGIASVPVAVHISKHTQIPNWKTNADDTHPTGSVWIKTTEYNAGAKWIVKRYNSSTSSWVTQLAPLYASGHDALYGLDVAGGGSKLPINTLYIKTNADEIDPPIANFKIFRRSATGATTITSSVITDTTFTMGETYTVYIRESVAGQGTLKAPIAVSFVGTDPNNLPGGAATKAQADAEELVSAILNAVDGDGHNFVNITAEATSANKVVIKHLLGGDFEIVDDNVERTVVLQFIGDTNFYEAPSWIQDNTDYPTHFLASLWKPLSGAVNSVTAPTTHPEDGTLWYNSIHDEVDILVHNGARWVGLQYDGLSGLSTTASPFFGTADPKGPITSATAPLKQSDGVTDLGEGDIWIDSSYPEFYPVMYRWNTATFKWDRLDTSDQTTENGVLFADARWSGAGDDIEPDSTQKLLTYDYIDPDCPAPVLYPRGMLLFNTRRSGFNVKKYVKNYINTSLGAVNSRQADASTVNYFPDRWVSVGGKFESGQARFGRHAQRETALTALRSLINSNQEIRDEESRVFNLIASPGYEELTGPMVNLNYDRGLTAFVVADSPSRLPPDATSLNAWGTNVNKSVEDDVLGLVTSDEYLGVFYPWGYTSDNLGKNIVVPPSHMMLRTIALSDNVSYPWFAPAGTRRGGITNASAVGYIDYVSGEFQSVALNTGQRDTLASVKVNPLTFITGTGLVNYGQYTRARNASALDRINVARLVVYLRRQLNNLAKPYIFEPNDKITRDEIKQAAESLMLELVGQRAIYDFLVVCDTSNNTPSRIDRNELYLDIAIEPVKAVEFIYIPLRLKNTGEIKGLGGK